MRPKAEGPKRAGANGEMPAGFMRRKASDVAVVFAAASILLVTLIGVFVDYSRVANAHTELQGRLDDALAAGARAEPSRCTKTAEARFDQTVTGSIARVDARRFEAGPDGLSGTVSATVPSTLSNLVGIRAFEVTARGHRPMTDSDSALPTP